MSDPIVIVGAARTPMGGFQGDFTGADASDLGGVAIKAALDRAGVDYNDVDEVLMPDTSALVDIHRKRQFNPGEISFIVLWLAHARSLVNVSCC